MSVVPEVTARNVSSNHGDYVPQNRRRIIPHAGRQQHLRQPESPVDAGVARPDQERFHPAPHVVDPGQAVEVIHVAVRRCAYRDEAARPRRRLRRMKRTTNHGPGTVRADQQVALGGVPARGQQSDTVARHREPGRLAVERDRVLPDRLQQGAVDGGAQRHHRRAAHRLRRGEVRTLQDGAVHPPRLTPRRHDPAGQHHGGDAQLAQRCHRVRGDEQRETKLPHRRGALEDADVPARLAEGDGSRQAADAGADDEGSARHAPAPSDGQRRWAVGSRPAVRRPGCARAP